MDDKVTDAIYEALDRAEGFLAQGIEHLGDADTYDAVALDFKRSLRGIHDAREKLPRRQAQEAPKALSKIICARCGEVCKPQSDWGTCTLCGDNICENCIPQGFDGAGCCGTCGGHKEAPKAASIRDAYESGYIRGHNDTVESCAVSARLAADEYAGIQAPKAESACTHGSGNRPGVKNCMGAFADCLEREKAASQSAELELASIAFNARMNTPDGYAKMIAEFKAFLESAFAAQRQAGREEMREELRQDYEDWRNKIEGQLAERYSAVVGALKNVSEAEQSVAYQKTGFSEQLAILSMLRHCGEIARKALSDLGAQVKL